MDDPVTPISSRMRQLHHDSLPRTNRSADSGYASLEASPPKTRLRTRSNRTSLSLVSRREDESLQSFDGTGSETSEVQDTDSDSEHFIVPSPCTGRQGSVTLPRTPRKQKSRTDSYPIVSACQVQHPRHGSDTAVTGSRARSLRALDRFVPLRDHKTPGSEKLHTTRPLEALTSSERLVRHNKDAPDPFCFRRRPLPPSPTESRKAARSGQSRTTLDPRFHHQAERRVSNSIWSVGGVAPSHGAVDDGRGGLVQSGTNAPMFNTMFPPLKPRAQEDVEKHEARLASAFEIDWSSRILGCEGHTVRSKKQHRKSDPVLRKRTHWEGSQLVKDDQGDSTASKPKHETRTLPTAPFKVLDAPSLRDDYYCSILAFSPICQTLAVGLGTRLYSWSEDMGVQVLEDNGPSDASWISTVDFSSKQGRRCILAYGRSNGLLNLMSLWDAPTLYDRQYPRFRPGPPVENEDLLVGDEQGNVFYYAVEWPLTYETYRHNWRGSVRCLAFISAHKQQICGLSWSPNGELFATGANDNMCFLFEAEKVTSYQEESDPEQDLSRFFSAFREPIPPQGFNLGRFLESMGSGEGLPRSPPLSWSQRQISNSSASSAGSRLTVMDSIDDRITSTSTPGPSLFATFFRPNTTTRFWDLNRIVAERVQPRDPPSLPNNIPTAFELFRNPISDTSGEPRHIEERHAKHRWEHNAAVKAIAFCPWREGLVATGGGSHDKCIHFFHTTSGVALATIAVHSQVTSLIWSTTRREIAATFGYAQPEHPYRIAVFSWPECRQVAAIPWVGEHRALYAVPYPRGPPDRKAAKYATGQSSSWKNREKKRNRTFMEGCIVVAGSDESIKFHEVWSGGKKATIGGVGLLGGSDILEDLEGIEKEGDVIR
ncbi:WD domain-containing protein [Diaporthe helianthi]|uniref:WD domain-containing protein n=1 Tax=Diaporthe helianthi TaxID=158607 RepID=A0A2P5I322_DIAHE|nr:WD domain-containing protein [Diaporthe helianthi]